MGTERRNFLRPSAGVAGATLLGGHLSYAHTDDLDAIQQRQDTPDVIKNLRRMTSDVVPITDDERKARIAKAQRLMAEQKIDAIYIESGTSMYYFTGMRWGQGCRMFKSPPEIALMQKANDLSIIAYRATWATMREGMTQQEFAGNCATAFRNLGVQGQIFCSFGKYTAFPHGSNTPQILRDGDMVLMDDGCTVEGYQSDITRTFVFGKPTQRQRDVWEIERKSQDAGFAAARVGTPCEAVDAAARKVLTDARFGPDYKTPVLPHRTGHGIGLDGHEWTNFVRGNKPPIQPGMCFSDEPTIAIYGDFGIRLEDCLYITEAGPKFFTAQSPSIDRPF